MWALTDTIDVAGRLVITVSYTNRIVYLQKQMVSKNKKIYRLNWNLQASIGFTSYVIQNKSLQCLLTKKARQKICTWKGTKT